MLSIRVEFPSGRYVAAQGDDPAQPEWPPHPSRLFSALVAAAYRSSGGMTESRRKALEWLESQAAPSLFAPQADTRPAPVTYVPPGDGVERKGKKGEEKYEHPVHRWRQPRHFPQASILGEPAVQFFWPSTPDAETATALHAIAQAVTHVGTSHSLALVQVLDVPLDDQFANYLPVDSGRIMLRTTTSGRLAELDTVFLQQQGVRRPFPVCETLTGYQLGTELALPKARYELLCLAVDGPRYALADTQGLMRSIRGALMGSMGDAAPATLHGHGESPHVAWLPLADVAHRHASGMNLGVGLCIPAALAEDERQLLLQGLAALPHVALPDGRLMQLRAIPAGDPAPQALQRQTWCASSHSWATVTPVVLDRPPRKADPDKVREALYESIVLAGYPEPEEVEISTHSAFVGAPFAMSFPASTPRYHAIVRFSELVTGPVIAGRQRHFGVGVFRPYQPQGVSA